MTVHQLSTRLFEKFDPILTLSNGRLVYAGSKDDAQEYFSRLGHPFPLQMNPAEHFLDLVNSDFV